MSTPILYLAIEEAKRELDARLLLANYALANGFRVVIGQQWLLVQNLPRMMPGVVFFKGMNRIQRGWMEHAKRCGHRIVAIDEEATALSDPEFLLLEFQPETLGLVDRLFMQGPNQHKAYCEKHPDKADQFVITGNPRWDLLRENFRGFFADETEAIRREYGRFILINTNFGHANSHWGSPEKYVQVCVNVGAVDLNDPFDQKWLREQREFERASMQSMYHLAKRLRDRYPGHRIVLRPHPAENMAVWHKALDREERIIVADKGSAIPWILASDLLVHNVCTTGIEGFLVGHPTVAYCPIESWYENIFIANVVTPRTATQDDLFAWVDRTLEEPEEMVRQSRARCWSMLEEHFANIDGDPASKAIFEQIRAVAPRLPPGSGMLRKGADFLRDMEMQDYQRRKISLTQDELLDRFALISRTNGMPVAVSAEQIGPSLFILEPQ